MYKLLGIRFHQYLYHEREKIEFIETEISDTGQLKDIAVKVDEKIIQITEFMATPLYKGKLKDLYDYHISTSRDQQYQKFLVKTGVFSIANPNHGTNWIDIDENITFHAHVNFTKNNNGWKVLSTLVYKTIIQEELSDTDAINLLILPDLNIKLPIKALMSIIIVLMGQANIPNDDFKEKIILCEIRILARFFTGDELSEMIEMLKTQTKNSEVERIIEKYGQGFDVIYFDGKEDGFKDGFKDGFNDGFNDGKLDVAKNLLAEGLDLNIISRNTGISINELEKLKRKL